MTLKQLKRYLMLHRVPGYVYCLQGGLPSDQYCIGKEGEAWQVYYSERGSKIGLVQFDSESEACQYFQDLMIEDGYIKK